MTTTPRSTGKKHTEDDPVSPSHYRNDNSGFECIQLAEHFNSGLLQQAFQYIWRAGQKDDLRQELDKALWFIGRESGFRSNHKDARPKGHSKEGEALFREWRVKVESSLRAAVLASLWRLDGNPRTDTLDFYTMCELVDELGRRAR